MELLAHCTPCRSEADCCGWYSLPLKAVQIALCSWDLKRSAEATEATGQCEVFSQRATLFGQQAFKNINFKLNLDKVPS